MFNFSNMTMLRQLRLAIVLSMMLALSGALLASLLSARGYLESQLSIKNTDNANALALSLSQNNPDEVMVELLVASLFDGGHYELVRITDPQGKPIAQREDTAHAHDAPAWFARLLPIEAQPGVAQINKGWQQFGQITVVSHSRFAYGALWRSATQMTLALSLAGLVGVVLGSRVLKRLSGPLKVVTSQAHAISERRFVTSEVPRVPELQQLASAMNTMVNKINQIFEDQSRDLDKLQVQVNTDAATGLANRSFFMGRMRSATDSADATGGSLIVGRLAHLQDINARLGREAADALIHDFASAFQRYAQRHDMALTGRLLGADFAVLIPSKAVSQEALSAFYQSVLAAVSPLLAGVTSTWVVGAVFKPGTAKENVLSQLEIAMAELEMQDTNNCRWIDASLALADDAPLPLNTQDWQQVFDDALLHRRLELASFAVTNFKGGLLHQECAMRLRMHADGKWLPAGEFWPMVERLRCTARFDLAGVRLGLAKLLAEPDLPGVAVNISGNSLMQSEFLPELLSTVQAHPQAHRLWLEVSEATAFAHFEAVAKLVAALKPARCKLGIEHFSKHFGRLGQLQQLGLDYLKLDASLVQQLEANTGNQTLLKGVLWIARNMGMMVVAQGVRRAEELETLANLGFDGATGPWIKSPRPSGPSQ